MKPCTQLRNTIFAAILFTASQTKAQVAPPTAMPGNKLQSENIGLAKADNSSSDAVTLDGLKLRNEKMFRNFTGQFANASDIAVFPHQNTTVIYCMVDGVRNNILYTNKGRMLHTIRYYDAAKLPQEVSELIAADFPDYKINLVSEVTAEGKTAYLVHIESARNFKIVRVMDNDWDIYQQFQKQQ